MKQRGYIGKILHVDLSNLKARVEELKEGWALQFIGKSGLGTNFLYEVTDERTDR